MRPSAVLTVAVASALSLAACDTVAEKIGIDTLTLPLGSVTQNVPIAGGLTGGTEQVISRPGPQLPDIVSVRTITVDPADLTFSPSTNAVAQTGTIEAALVVGGYPAGVVNATIRDGQVTSVSPMTLNVGAFNAATVRAMYDAVTVGTKPTMASGWDTAPPATVQASIGTALRSSTIRVGLIARTTGTMQGTMTLTKVTLGLSY